MIKLPTKDEEKLKELREQLDSVERYSEEYFKLREKWRKLFHKVEKARRSK